VGFPSKLSASGFVATVGSEPSRLGTRTRLGTGTRTRLGTSTASTARTVPDASLVDIPCVALAPVLAGRRRALPGALEEAVERNREALLATDTHLVFRARVEDG
jgi:hypothetical protein